MNTFDHLEPSGPINPQEKYLPSSTLEDKLPRSLRRQRQSEMLRTGGLFDRFTFICLWIFVFSIPWERAIVYEASTTFSQLWGIVIFVIGLLAIITRGWIENTNAIQVCGFLFVGWVWCSNFWSVAPDNSFVSGWIYTRLLAMVWLICQFTYTRSRQRGLFQAYILGCYITVSETFRNLLVGQGWYGYISFGYLERYGVAGINPNDLALILALGIPVAWYLALVNKNGLLEWINFLYIPAAIAAIFLTGSRGASIAAACALMIIPWTLSHLSLGRRLVLTISIVGLAIAFQNLALPNSPLARIQTIPAEIQEGTLGGRSYLWNAALQSFIDKPFFGTGAGTSFYVMPASTVVHNTLLSVLVELGLVGLALFVGVHFFWLGRALNKDPIDRKLFVTLLLSLIVGGVSVSWEHAVPVWFLFGVVASGESRMRQPDMNSENRF